MDNAAIPTRADDQRALEARQKLQRQIIGRTREIGGAINIDQDKGQPQRDQRDAKQKSTIQRFTPMPGVSHFQLASARRRCQNLGRGY